MWKSESKCWPLWKLFFVTSYQKGFRDKTHMEWPRVEKLQFKIRSPNAKLSNVHPQVLWNTNQGCQKVSEEKVSNIFSSRHPAANFFAFSIYLPLFRNDECVLQEHLEEETEVFLGYKYKYKYKYKSEIQIKRYFSDLYTEIKLKIKT